MTLRRLLFAAAPLTLLFACGEPTRAPVELDWTFAGTDCATAGVRNIQVDVAGEVLSPNTFACQDNAGNVTTGADLGRYLTGNYVITVTGLDSNNDVAYQGQSTFHVAPGQNVFHLDTVLIHQPAGSGGTLTLLWTFNGGMSCATAGVTTMHVFLDGSAITDGSGNANLPCHSGSADGTSIDPVDAGGHTVDLEGFFGNGSLAYSKHGVPVTVTDNVEKVLSVDLPPAP